MHAIMVEKWVISFFFGGGGGGGVAALPILRRCPVGYAKDAYEEHPVTI